jgi:hypothetical protein
MRVGAGFWVLVIGLFGILSSIRNQLKAIHNFEKILPTTRNQQPVTRNTLSSIFNATIHKTLTGH